jgi:hypothetical protein
MNNNREKFVNLNNPIVKNVLTHEQRYRLYQNISVTSGKTLLPDIAQQMTPFRPDKDILQVFIDIMKKETGTEFVLADMCFARYELLDTGTEKMLKPRLGPHKDVLFKKPRITLDYQVSSNIDWDIMIEDRSYGLKDNDLLIFSGTDQFHSRPEREFKKGEYMDLLFMHFSETGEETSFKDIMRVGVR